MPRHRWHNRALIAIDVVEFGLSALLRLADANRFPRDQLRRFTFRIAQIPSNDGVFRAHDHTSRFQSNFGAVRTEMALGSRAIVRVHIYRIVRTSLHAGFAANAPVGIEIHNSVLALLHRSPATPPA